jgi:hypothetical protein
MAECLRADKAGLASAQIQPFLRKYPWVPDRLRELERREDILNGLRMAALESNLLRKFREFDRWLRAGVMFFHEKAPPTDIWGQDEFMPLQLSVCIVANPPFLVSNCAYVRDFCNLDFLHDMALAMMSVLCGIARTVFGAKAPEVCTAA